MVVSLGTTQEKGWPRQELIVRGLFQVDHSYLTLIPPIKETGDLFTSKLRLRFQLKQHHFVQVSYLQSPMGWNVSQRSCWTDVMQN